MEDVDTVVGDIAEEAAAEASRIAAKEAAKDADEAAADEATKGAAGAAKATSKASAEGASGGPAGEAGKASAEEEVVGDQPPSSSTSGPGRYLKMGDDLFIHLPGASSSRAPAGWEVFDGEVLSATGLEVVDEPGVGGDGSPEEQLFRAMGANFRKLQVLYRARLDKVKSRMATVDNAEVDFKARVAETQTWFHQTREEQRAFQEKLAERDVELTMKMADIKKAQEKAVNLAAAAEASQNQHQAALDS